MAEKKEEPVIIKKIKKGGHGGHHGGAWKVAYADFVTAMMAFFLVMWILGLSESTKKQIATWVREPGIFDLVTGKSLPIGMSNNQTARYEVVKDDKRVENFDNVAMSNLGGPNLYEAFNSLDSVEKARFMQAVEDSIAYAQVLVAKEGELLEKMEQELRRNPNFEELLKSIDIEMTRDGLRIELLETESSVYFKVGAAGITDNAKTVLSLLAGEIGLMPNNIVIEGHTDSRPYGKNSNYSNWELSADRANAARTFLEEKGIRKGQVSQVTGFSDRKLRTPSNPFDISNRRISILIEFLETDKLMGE